MQYRVFKAVLPFSKVHSIFSHSVKLDIAVAAFGASVVGGDSSVVCGSGGGSEVVAGGIVEAAMVSTAFHEFYFILVITYLGMEQSLL